MSPAGSACAHEPAKVPRCRIWLSATSAAALDSSNACCRTRSSVTISEWVVIAPITSASPSSRTPRRLSIRPRSITISGALSRIRSTGRRLCPPAMIFASSPCSASAFSASSTEVGAT